MSAILSSSVFVRILTILKCKTFDVMSFKINIYIYIIKYKFENKWYKKILK